MTLKADTDDESTADRFGIGRKTARAAGLGSLARQRGSAPHAADPSLNLESLPDPDAPAGPGDRLTPAERADLATCETVIRAHHAAFWMTGKALDAVAERRLYRETHDTYEALLEDWGISLADSSRMRRGWRLAERLLPTVSKLTRSHIEALLPVVDRYGTDAAAILYALLAESLPKVTAATITETVRMLPGPDGDTDPIEQIRAHALALYDPETNEEHDQDVPTQSTPADAALRQAVADRAAQLATDLKRARIPRQELARTLTEAFADPSDPRVYRALVRWMKDREKEPQT